jgi:hypothetical protein
MLSTLRAEQQQIQYDMQYLMCLSDQQRHLQQRLDDIKSAISNSAVLTSTISGSSQTRQGGRSVRSDWTRILNRQDYIGSDIDQLASKFKQLRAPETTRSIVAETPEVLARVVRAELQGIVMQTIEECISQYDHRFESTIRKAQEAITSINLDLFGKGGPYFAVSFPLAEDILCVSRNHLPVSEFSPSRGRETKILRNKCGECRQILDDSTFRCISSGDDLSSPSQWLEFRQQSSQFTWRKTIIQIRNWHFSWIIGNLNICIKILASDHAKRQNHRFELLVDFYPSFSIFLRRGFSLKFTTGAGQRGYYQLCPTIAVFRVVNTKDLSDLRWLPKPIEEIQYRLENKLIHLTDRDEFGFTYLHVSYNLIFYGLQTNSLVVRVGVSL